MKCIQLIGNNFPGIFQSRFIKLVYGNDSILPSYIIMDKGSSSLDVPGQRGKLL